jgi:hypothetical protein
MLEKLLDIFVNPGHLIVWKPVLDMNFEKSKNKAGVLKNTTFTPCRSAACVTPSGQLGVASGF